MVSENYVSITLQPPSSQSSFDDHKRRAHPRRLELQARLSLAATAKQITTGLALMRWNLCDEKMEPGRCVGGRGTEQKGKRWLGLPARLGSLESTPNVSLYRIALYCRFIPDILAMTERLNLRQGSATIADSHGATVGKGDRGRSAASPSQRPAPADRCRNQQCCLPTKRVRPHGSPIVQGLPGRSCRYG
jgi:hypothetical protein